MKITALCLWIVLTRVAYYFLIQGPHDGLFFLKMNGLKDIAQYLGFAGFLLVTFDYKLSFKIKVAVIFALVYCTSFACIMLYPFMGSEYTNNSEQFLFIYNSFWVYATAALLIYLIFVSDKFSVKSPEL